MAPGSVVRVLPLARDRDTNAAHAKVKYLIESGNEAGKFRLDAATGELSLAQELERREAKMYELLIRATSRDKTPTVATRQRRATQSSEGTSSSLHIFAP